VALLNTQTIDRTGLAPVYGAVSASDTFAPGDRVFLHVKNTGGRADTITFITPGSAIPGVTLGDPSVVVPATTGDRMIGPFPGGYFADPTTNLVTVNHSATTGVTCAVIGLSSP
jgi:hypothetical protein